MMHTIDNVRKDDMSKIYCKCGSIVSLDKRSIRIKNALKKTLECPMCRNFRISNEIQYMNDLFSGTLDEEMTA
jgi:hypothetical protein